MLGEQYAELREKLQAKGSWMLKAYHGNICLSKWNYERDTSTRNDNLQWYANNRKRSNSWSRKGSSNEDTCW
jgi:hypothetical protein